MQGQSRPRVLSGYEDPLFLSEDYDIKYESMTDYIPFLVYNVSRKMPTRINDFNLIEHGIEAVVDFIPLHFIP